MAEIENERPASCNVTNFSVRDMTLYGRALRTLGAGASSMEEVAGRVVRFLYDNLLDEHGERACVLVRFFKTHPYGALDDDLQRIAGDMLGSVLPAPEMKSLVLLGTVGVEPEWNSRMTSKGHQAIPLPSEETINQIPMIGALVKQLGLTASTLVKPDPKLLLDMEQRTFNVFYISDAVDSPYIPAQKEFVAPYRVWSVLGFGGLLPSGEVFAVIMFLRVPVSRQTAELFATLSLNAKIALLPFDRTTFA